MKLTLIQFIAFGFVLGWVLCDVIGGTHTEKIKIATIIALVVAYIHNAHGLIWQRLKCLAKPEQPDQSA